MDVSRYNTAPMAAAKALLFSGTEAQRFGFELMRDGHERLSRLGDCLAMGQEMQREGFQRVLAARRVIARLSEMGHVDAPHGPESARQRAAMSWVWDDPAP